MIGGLLGRCSYRASVANRHPTAALVVVLIRYLAWGISTCSVERDFANTLKLRGGQCEDPFVHREEDLLCLQSDNNPAEHDEIICKATRVWSTTYGNARLGTTNTIRANTPQRQGHGSGEAAFLRVRREATDAVACNKPPGPMPTDADTITYNDKQAKEVNERNKKLDKRRIDALKAGHLQDNEVDAALIEAAIATIEKDRVNARDAATDKRRKLQIVAKRNLDIDGRSVYLGVPGPDLAGMVASGSMLADFIVVANPGDPSPLVKCAACLKGSSVCTKDFLATRGQHGACVSYSSAILVKRHVYMSDGFLHEKPDLADVLLQSMAHGLWELASIPDLVGVVRGRPDRQRLAFLFLASDEEDRADAAMFVNKFTAQSCFESPMFCNLGKSGCWVGACTRCTPYVF